jgi:hypothetical protein
MVSYGKGGVALLCKHKMYKNAFVLTFRGLGGFAIYTLKGEFKIALAYLESFFVRFFYLLKFYFSGVI